MARIDDVNFYLQPADKLAVELLGKAIVRNIDGEIHRYLIAETECYMGVEDTACHACKGKTPRASTLWERGGKLYVYLIYGIYNLMNIIAGNEGEPMGVLIRGVKDINGPGRVARKLGIGKDFNKEDLLISERIWLEETNLKPEYITTPRIGIDYARKEDRERLWRFVAYDSLKDIDI
ncbi:MAG: DNA-3-methyladenine glycosylase [Clostridiales bacterium]|jgi:DNA-3-methyladenine glycosylase|nr:DNA-3-methyladenine glycosylase [Clostridiales bacterium]HOB64042.1 DNA-3-methyladenine glycosylase [Clostridia bacterium]